MWYRSLYWRIGVGFVALLAILLGVQALIFLYLSGAGILPGRSATEIGRRVAVDLSQALAQNRSLDLEQHVRREWGRVPQPLVVVMADGRVVSARDVPPPPGMLRAARARLRGFQGSRPGAPGPRDEPFPPRPPDGAQGTGRRPEERPEELFDIEVDGSRAGVVAISTRGPQLFFLLRESGPTLALIGAVLLLLGSAVASLVIFGPARKRMRKLEEAAVALGAGRIGVRAPDEGADEVSALARAFNRMAETLQESNEARRRLLADVSHELRTPLTAIRGYVETLSMPELSLDAATRERYLRIVDEEAQKLERLVGDLLDVARLEAGGTPLRLQPVQVAHVFQRVIDRHEGAAAEKGVRIEIDIDPAAREVVADADRLEQAVQNLAANAVRHTPPGGRVALQALREGERTRLLVRDTGPGIPAEHLARVFDRFYKADAARATGAAVGGSGLGLSIVKAIVESHGGRVTATNDPEGGAIFEIELR